VTLRASLQFSLTKGVASKFNGNPRSHRPAVGELTLVPPSSEAAWRLFHRAVDPPSCVWPVNEGGAHRSAKPKWGNPMLEFAASSFKYEITTCVGLQRVLDCFRLLEQIANGDDGDVFSPFPQGYIQTGPCSFKPVLGSVVDRIMMHPPAFTESIEGETGTIIGKR
jgi:hypothetical protein